MGRLVVKETVTKEREIEVSIEALLSLVDTLTLEEKKNLLKRISASLKEKKESLELKPFKKDKLENIIADFSATNIYEDEFLRDLEEGIKKSTIYR